MENSTILLTNLYILLLKQFGERLTFIIYDRHKFAAIEQINIIGCLLSIPSIAAMCLLLLLWTQNHSKFQLNNNDYLWKKEGDAARTDLVP